MLLRATLRVRIYIILFYILEELLVARDINFGLLGCRVRREISW